MSLVWKIAATAQRVGARGIGVALLLLLSVPAVAQTTWIDRDAEGGAQVHLYFFWSETCPHCEEARPFVEAIPRERPWVRLHSLEVSANRDNARRFVELAQSLGQAAEAVPTLAVCGEMEVGWQDAASSGAALLARLDACRQFGRVDPAASGATAGAVQVPLLGRIESDRFSLPIFTLVLAGLDAFNPCAFFVLLFLLSLLAHQKNRRRMLAIGGTFVLTSGIMYFAFMAAWLNLFQMLGTLTWITLAAGIVAVLVGLINIKDFFAFERGISLSIPASRKPDLYRRARTIISAENFPAMLGATVLLAVAANFYELLCTAGFPMVYTRILTMNELTPAARYGYLALYNLIYVIPLALIVAAFIGTLGARRLTEREGRLLKLMSGVMMLELGALLALAPGRLSNLWTSALLLAVAVGVTAIAARSIREPSTRH
jgi:hypothetical protein